MKNFIALIIVVCLCLLANAANSAPKNLDALKKAAESGDPLAQYEYAEEFAWNGDGMAAAMPWYEKSAAAGNPYAQTAVLNYRLSRAKDSEEKILAAECPKFKEVINVLEKDRSAEGLYNLADIYENETCVKNDEGKAKSLYMEAAEKGQAAAQLRLARIYKEEKDPAQMMHWYIAAMNNGMNVAPVEIAQCYYNGNCGVEKDLARAEEYAGTAEKMNGRSNRMKLGMLYYGGKGGFPKNPARGRAIIEKVAAEGFAPAQKWLAKHPAGSDGK